MKPKTDRQKIIRVGVVGIGRGQSFASGATDLAGYRGE